MAYTRLLYHIVFSTKERKMFLDDDIRPRVRDYIGGIIHGEGGQLVAGDGPADHIHLAVSLPATQAVADIVRVVKTNSSKWLHEQVPQMRDFSWQDGYSAFTVSPSVLSRVVRYISGQAEHHKRISFDDELRRLLKRHGIDFDPKYL